MKVLLVWPNKDQWGFKPMGLSLLSAILKRDGHEVDLFDTTYIDFVFQDNTSVRSKIKIFKPVDFSNFDLEKKRVDLSQEVLVKLRDFKPDIVGISALSDEVDVGLDVSRIVKNWDAKIIVIWGNKAATMAPEKILASFYVDYICLGEGIEFISEFVRGLEQGKDPRLLPNLAFRDENGQIRKNSLRPHFQDLDSLPYFDWSFFDQRHFLKPYDGKVYRGGDHMIFWGCPNICTYCINAAYRKLYGPLAGPYLRRYSVDRVIEELKFLVEKWDIEVFKYHDEDFCLKPIDYFRELAEKYSREIAAPFVAMANARNVNEGKVTLLKKMNCLSITLGIETGNSRLRKEVLKRTETAEEIIRATKLLNQAGIRTSAFNMLAIPFENRKTIMETIELNKRAEVHYPNAGFFFPLDGTELRDIAIKNNFFDGDPAATFKNDRPTLRFPDITAEELIALRERFVLYIKMPYEFYPFIERSEKHDIIGQQLTELLYQIYDEAVFTNDGVWDDGGKLPQYLNCLRVIWDRPKADAEVDGLANKL